MLFANQETESFYIIDVLAKLILGLAGGAWIILQIIRWFQSQRSIVGGAYVTEKDVDAKITAVVAERDKEIDAMKNDYNARIKSLRQEIHHDILNDAKDLIRIERDYAHSQVHDLRNVIHQHELDIKILDLTGKKMQESQDRIEKSVGAVSANVDEVKALLNEVIAERRFRREQRQQQRKHDDEPKHGNS